MVPVGEAEDVIQETGVGSLSDCVHLLFICAPAFMLLLLHGTIQFCWFTNSATPFGGVLLRFVS